MAVPKMLFVPSLLNADGSIDYEAGAFTTEGEAKRVVDEWLSAGETKPTAINLIPLYETVEEWREDQ